MAKAPQPSAEEPGEDGGGSAFLVPAERQVILDRYLNGDGQITPAGRKLMGKPKTKGEKAVRDEIVVWLWTFKRMLPDCRKQMTKSTGLTWMVIEKIIQDHHAEVLGQGGALQIIEEQVELQKVRHEGRKLLIEGLWDTAVRARKVLEAKLQTMEPRQAATVMGIAIDKALLLSGQPTSRVARTDERFLTDQELQEKLMKTGQRLQLITLEIERSRLTATMKPAEGGSDVSVHS